MEWDHCLHAKICRPYKPEFLPLLGWDHIFQYALVCRNSVFECLQK